MTGEASKQNPEIPKQVSDNDRKFIIADIDHEFLRLHEATSYYLITDCLETNEDDETKLARKTYPDGSVELLHIAKVMINDDRKTVKKKITEQEFQDFLMPDMPHVEKTRYEFVIEQNGHKFKAKYDIFTDSPLRILEIDAETDDIRRLFRPELFDYSLSEVSDDKNYRGYRVQAML